MTVFDDAKTEWQSEILPNHTWASPVFGDTYYIRYPIDVGTKEASAYKQSVFKGDDSVHAWDAKGVRQKIIQRLIESQERTIRPWYGELSYFADNLKFLLPMPEQELDFILRTSLYSNQENEDDQLFYKARQNLLEHLDPKITTEIEAMPIGDEKPEDRAKKYSKCQIELYGFLNIIKDRLFILTNEEILQVIELLLDVSASDKFLVKRFIDPDEDDNKPLVGQGNQATKLKSNFMLKYLGGGNPEFYKYRVFQLWLRNLLDFDARARNYIEERKIDIIQEFKDYDTIKSVLLQAIKLYKWNTIKDRLLALLQIEYASKKDFTKYKSDITLLLNARNEFFSDLASKPYELPIELKKYDAHLVCYELGLVMIESIARYLSKQIPEPTGFDKLQARMILNKRIDNLKKYVVTDELKEEILLLVSNLYQNLGQEDEEKVIEEIIRTPYDKLIPRGNYYFKKIETEVKAFLQETGDRDLRKELAASTDDPQTLVKQYGKQALETLEGEYDLKELYSTILALKSAELIFSGSILTALKRQRVIQSLISDIFSPQFDFLKLLAKEEDSSQMEE
ncbi:MAG: hypothetical protein ACFFCZ_09915 [Promethearchaeota archaeon]